MTKTEQSRKAYNKKAGNYDDTYDGRVTRPLKQMMLDVVNVQQGQTVVDVACGTGDFISALSKKADINAYGIDIAEQMITVASEKYKEVSFMVAPAVPLPFDSGSVDIITVSAAFHHFEDPRGFANECNRVLRSDGSVYIGEFHIPPIARRIMNLLIPFVRTGDVKIYSDAELAEFFINAGFKTKIIRIDGPRIVMKCDKI